MNEDFYIISEWLEGSDRDPVENAAFAQIVVVAAQQITTEVEDLFARTIRPGLRASAYDLAVWLAENWWRLRWEPEANSDDWRLSHVLAAVGGGFAWPDICFASDGVHVMVGARKTHGGENVPVRYIRDIDVQISAAAFEEGVDKFIERVLARLSSVGTADTDLGILWQQLRQERGDKNICDQRRLEALLGFDPGEAPNDLITSLKKTTAEAGRSAVDEIAAAEKQNASVTLRDILERTRASDVSIRVESASNILRGYSDQASPTELPWQRATRAARLARDVWGVKPGPVSNGKLSELMSVPVEFLQYTSSNGLPVAAGHRTNLDADDVNVVMRAKVQTGRRFEIMRLVADHIVAVSDDLLLPATTEKTDRQKFQRAFAQEFLLPSEELGEEMRSLSNSDNISDHDTEDIAQHYDVSPLLVNTVLVNRGFLPRDTLHATN